MSSRLTRLQERLCNVLQEGLPICPRPFAEVAKVLNMDEVEVLQQTRKLKELGVIKRIAALINHRALGMASTLVAAHVPEQSLKEVADVINSLENVSHNYQRNHHYNLWFTLQARTPTEIDVTLSNLSGRFGIDFHSLPARRVFKLDVRFDAESGGQFLLQDVQRVPKDEPVELDENQKLILSKLQQNLELTEEPFGCLCGDGLESKDVLRIITELIDSAVIHRVAAVVDHRKLGFVANVLFAGEVPQDRVVKVGTNLARLAIVSHCYERETFEGWPYNLFAMVHSRTMGQIRQVIDEFSWGEKIDSFQLLPTIAELKKQPLKRRFP